MAVICCTALADFNSSIKHSRPQLLPFAVPYALQRYIVTTRLVQRDLVVVEIDRLAIAALSNSIPEPIAHTLEKLGHSAAIHIIPRHHPPQQEKINYPPNTAQATSEQPDEPSDGVLGIKTMRASEAKYAP
jgi:hypothetical protein